MNKTPPGNLPDLPAFLSGDQTGTDAGEAADALSDLTTSIEVTLEHAGGGGRAVAQMIVEQLVEQGHIVPGCPPALQILKDAQQFAGQLALSNLATRVYRMVKMTHIVTPESAGTEKWITDYLDGKNHGPIGKPMLWPRQLPGLAQLLRDWGFQPTPTKPAFVARMPQQNSKTLN